MRRRTVPVRRVLAGMRTALLTLGFALGFWMLLSGGAALAAVVLGLVHADTPSLGLLGQTALCLGLPLLAFRAYDRSRPTTPS